MLPKALLPPRQDDCPTAVSFVPSGKIRGAWYLGLSDLLVDVLSAMAERLVLGMVSVIKQSAALAALREKPLLVRLLAEPIRRE
jgi:hypothetical protein